jgi:serine/threonine-protein kinase RsbT
LRIRLIDDSGLRQSILEARQRALAIGFDATEAAQIATATSELGRNVLKYAGVGLVDIREVNEDLRVGIEITVSDKGPGIADIDQALEDHFSSSGTLGLGLPGVKRLMDDFEIGSNDGKGTRVRIRKWRG